MEEEIRRPRPAPAEIAAVAILIVLERIEAHEFQHPDPWMAKWLIRLHEARENKCMACTYFRSPNRCESGCHDGARIPKNFL